MAPLNRFACFLTRWASAFAGEGSGLSRGDSIASWDLGFARPSNRHSRPLLWPSVTALAAASCPHWLIPRFCGQDTRLHYWSGWMFVSLWLCAGLALLVRGRVQTCEAKARPMTAAALVLGALAMGFGRGLYWCKALDVASRLSSRRLPLSVEALLLDAPKEMGSGSSFPALVLDSSVTSGKVKPGGVPSSQHDSLAFDFRGQKVIVRVQATPDSVGLQAGDIVSVTGRLAIPDPAMNPGQFDYQRYLLSQRVFSLLDGNPSLLSSTEQDPQSRSWRLIFRRGVVRAMAQFGQSVRNSLDMSLPSEDAAVMKAMLLADDGELEEGIGDDFRRAGLRRFLNLTGFHVDAVSWAIFSLVQKTTKRYNLSRLLAITSAVALAWTSGWTAGAIRASVSISMRFGAPMVRRKYDPLAALSVGALLTAWAIPSPLGDAGFRMSFAGALGAWVGGRYLRSGGLGMAAVLVPIMTQQFRNVSVAGLVAGGLWASVVSSAAILTLAILALPCGMVTLGWLPYLVSQGVRVLASLVSRIPLASVSFPALSWGEIVSWYGLLALWAWHLEARWKGGSGRRHTVVGSLGSNAGDRGQIRKTLVLAAAASLLISAWLRAYPPWPEITFLSVGQGDCAVIRYRSVCIMVDTGTESQFERFVLPYLRYKGVSRVDLCVLSHLHSDHAGGAPALCSRFEVGTLVTMPETAAELRKNLKQGIPPILEAQGSGTTLALGSLRLVTEPLGSVGISSSEGGNEACLAAFLWAGNATVEFWADLPAPLISEYLARASFGEARNGIPRIVKVPHHGSVDGLVAELYSGGPKSVAVISVGPNSYGHPSPAVMDCLESAGVPVFRTDRRGAVVARVIGGRFWIFSHVCGRKLGR